MLTEMNKTELMNMCEELLLENRELREKYKNIDKLNNKMIAKQVERDYEKLMICMGGIVKDTKNLII